MTTDPLSPTPTLRIALSLAMTLTFCTQQTPAWANPAESAQATANRFAHPIETAHGLAAWQAQKAVQANITITFGSQEHLKGQMTFETTGGRVRMQLAEDTVLVFDGQDAWISPANAARDGARFDLLTWPYFVAAPMKLRDPGTHIQELGAVPLHQHPTPAAKLTFDQGVGDSPDDWYILYRDQTSHHLVAMAYIVTYGKDTQEAEKEPHAITYDGFETIDGVVVSTQWKFWHWSPDRGVHGEPMGQAVLSDIRFVEPGPKTFAKPVDSRLDPVPSP